MKRTGRVLAAVVIVVSCVGAMSGAAAAPAGSGYWMLGGDGTVYGFGSATQCGDSVNYAFPAVDIEPFPNGLGYWVLLSNGLVDDFLCDGVPFEDVLSYHGSNAVELVVRFDALREAESAVSLSAMPDGTGYWVFTSHGRVLSFGDAPWFGDMGAVALNGPILDSVATPTGGGYWMVGSDGGVFSFGDAQFYGSMGDQRLNAPVTSMAPDPDGVGYWLVARDGGIFAFDAPFFGSTGSIRLNQPVTGIVQSSTGAGYLMVARDGGIFAFGDVPFHGSLGAAPPPVPITAVAVLP